MPGITSRLSASPHLRSSRPVGRHTCPARHGGRRGTNAEAARPRWLGPCPRTPLALLHDLRVAGGADDAAALWTVHRPELQKAPTGAGAGRAAGLPASTGLQTAHWTNCPPPNAQSQGADSSPGGRARRHPGTGSSAKQGPSGTRGLALCTSRQMQPLGGQRASSWCTGLARAVTPRSGRLHLPWGSSPAVCQQRQEPW